MVSIVRFLHPTRGKFMGEPVILVGFGFLAALIAHFGKRPQRADGFGRKIHVVRQMAGKVVRAKLIFGIKSFFFEVLSPLLELLPIESGKIGVPFHF